MSFQARRVFLVLGADDGAADVRVELDGEPVSDENAGSDVSNGVVRVSRQRLYRLVDLPECGHFSFLEQPDAVHAAIAEVLDRN